MAKQKTYGPANDVGLYRGETLAAELISAAASRDMKACRKAYYRDKQGNVQASVNHDTAYCCAVGAASMAGIAVISGQVIDGNDFDDAPWHPGSEGFDAGTIFYDVLKAEYEQNE